MMTLMSLKKGYQKGDYMEAKPACEPRMLILPVILKAVPGRYKSRCDPSGCISMWVCFFFFNMEIIFFLKERQQKKAISVSWPAFV